MQRVVKQVRAAFRWQVLLKLREAAAPVHAATPRRMLRVSRAGRASSGRPLDAAALRSQVSSMEFLEAAQAMLCFSDPLAESCLASAIPSTLLFIGAS